MVPLVWDIKGCTLMFVFLLAPLQRLSLFFSLFHESSFLIQFDSEGKEKAKWRSPPSLHRPGYESINSDHFINFQSKLIVSVGSAVKMLAHAAKR